MCQSHPESTPPLVLANVAFVVWTTPVTCWSALTPCGMAVYRELDKCGLSGSAHKSDAAGEGHKAGYLTSSVTWTSWKCRYELGCKHLVLGGLEVHAFLVLLSHAEAISMSFCPLGSKS